MAISIRQTFVGVLAVLGALAPLACSGAVAAPGPATAKDDQSLLKEGACFGEVMGGDTSCKPAETWKEYAVQACENRGLSLGDLSYGPACDGGFTAAKYACCKEAPQPLPPDPGPNPAACFGDAQGGPASCKPADVWTKLASELCVAKGSAIAHIAFAESCDDGTGTKGGAFRFTKYECCAGGEPPPPPPPPRCETTLLGGAADKSCQPAGTWKEAAYDFCTSRKQLLTDLALDGACGPDSSSAAKVTCCSAEPDPKPYPYPYPDPGKEPPPPPDPVPPQEPGACIGLGEGGDQCIELSTWKLNASTSCEKQGMHLTELYFGASCKEGAGALEAKYVCCK